MRILLDELMDWFLGRFGRIGWEGRNMRGKLTLAWGFFLWGWLFYGLPNYLFNAIKRTLYILFGQVT
jgi:hypothetical protein